MMATSLLMDEKQRIPPTTKKGSEHNAPLPDLSHSFRQSLFLGLFGYGASLPQL